MRVSGIKFESINAKANVVANKAKEIDSALKNSTDKIKESINDTKEAGKKVDEDYKKALEAVQDIKNFSNLFSRRAEFSVNKEINRVIIRIIDSNTNNTIKEIPATEIQHIQKRIKELLALLFDKETLIAEKKKEDRK